jgi:hypothetical protein
MECIDNAISCQVLCAASDTNEAWGRWRYGIGPVRVERTTGRLDKMAGTARALPAVKKVLPGAEADSETSGQAAFTSRLVVLLRASFRTALPNAGSIGLHIHATTSYSYSSRLELRLRIVLISVLFAPQRSSMSR